MLSFRVGLRIRIVVRRSFHASLHVGSVIVVRWSSHASLHGCTWVISSSWVDHRMRRCIVARRCCHRRALVFAFSSSLVFAFSSSLVFACVAASLLVGGAILVRCSSHASRHGCILVVSSSCVGLRMRCRIVARQRFHHRALVIACVAVSWHLGAVIVVRWSLHASLHRCTSLLPSSCIGLCMRCCIVTRRWCHRRASVFTCFAASLHVGGVIVVCSASHASLHPCMSVMSLSCPGLRMRHCIVSRRWCHRRALVFACVVALLHVGGDIVVCWSSHASIHRCTSLVPSSCVGPRMRRCIVARRWFHRRALVSACVAASLHVGGVIDARAFPHAGLHASLHRCRSVVPSSCVGLRMRHCIVAR